MLGVVFDYIDNWLVGVLGVVMCLCINSVMMEREVLDVEICYFGVLESLVYFVMWFLVSFIGYFVFVDFNFFMMILLRLMLILFVRWM